MKTQEHTTTIDPDLALLAAIRRELLEEIDKRSANIRAMTQDIQAIRENLETIRETVRTL